MTRFTEFHKTAARIGIVEFMHRFSTPTCNNPGRAGILRLISFATRTRGETGYDVDHSKVQG